MKKKILIISNCFGNRESSIIITVKYSVTTIPEVKVL